MRMTLVPPASSSTMRLIEVEMPWPPRVDEVIWHPDGGSYKVREVSYAFCDQTARSEPPHHELRHISIYLKSN